MPRRERRRNARQGSTDFEVGRPEFEGEQEAALVHRDLLRAFAELPEEQRSVLFLVTVEDLSYGEAARARVHFAPPCASSQARSISVFGPERSRVTGMKCGWVMGRRMKPAMTSWFGPGPV